MKCEPKRTGVGMLLAYHLAKEAKAAGIKTLGTDLSALEEGTPEFYQAIGLTPSPERVDMAVDAVSGMPAATERAGRQSVPASVSRARRVGGHEPSLSLVSIHGRAARPTY